MKVLNSALAVAVALMVDGASAWYSTGHVIVARIAYEVLMKEMPEQVTAVEEILSVLKESNPNITKDEKDHPFVECASFADEVFPTPEGSYQFNWHFVD